MTFDNLKGIEKEREEKGREKSTVEYLLETCNEVIQEYKTKITNNYNEMQEVYQAMYKKIEKKLPEYNEKDLTSLIFTKANNEHVKKESTALGLYTGILLHILTKRNQKKGKKTQFYINGKGNKFDYLFYFAKEVDELTIESFTGDNICECIASYEGKANKITLNNNKGNYTAWYAGSDQGNINTLIINNNKGDNTAWNAGGKGNIKTLIINNNKGNYTAWYAGSDQGNINTLIINNNKGDNTAWNAGSEKGNINTLIINNNKGNNTAEDAGFNGNINTLIINNNKGNNPAWYAGSEKGNINTLIINNNKGNNPAWYAGSEKGNINKIIINNITGENIVRGAKAKQIITEKEALQEYQEIIQLLNSFKNKTPEEMIAIAEQVSRCLNN